MAKFRKVTKRTMKNAQHFAFIQAFITAVTGCSFTATRIVAKLAELVAAFQVEDDWYMKIQASQIVAQRQEAGIRRGHYYVRLHRLVEVWAGSGMAVLDAAASALLPIFKLYSVKTNGQVDEVTGQIDNLKTDLSTTEMQANITAINGNYLFDEMVTAHEQVKELRLEQGAEEGEKEYGVLANARKQCDALYDELTEIIEGAASFSDDPTPYETFITHWNGTVKLYQEALGNKTTTETGSDSNQSGTSESGNQGGTSAGNQGGSTGGNNNGGTSGGGNNGGSTGGDNGGSSGGGDNGGGGGSDWGNGSDE